MEDMGAAEAEDVRMAGYKFMPSGEELMIHLVHHMTAGWDALDGGEIIKDVDLYGEASNPWTVLEESRQRDGCWYVITRLKKAKPGQKRNKRSAGCGTWNARQTHDVTLHYAGLRYQGSHRYYLFVEDPKTKKQQGSDHNGHWVMDEYSFNNHQDEDYAICKIRNKAAPKVACKRSYEDLDHILNTSLGKKMRIGTTSTSTHDQGVVDDENERSKSDDQGVVAYDQVSSDHWLNLDDDHYLEKLLLGQSADPDVTTSTSTIKPYSSEHVDFDHDKFLNDIYEVLFDTSHLDLVVGGEGDDEQVRSNNTTIIEDEAASLQVVHGTPQVDDYSCWLYGPISDPEEWFNSPDVIQACN